MDPGRTLGTRCQEANPLPPAHHILNVQEIACMICEHLYRDKTTLYHLAQTCRSLRDPALRILWRKLWDLSLLIRTMPCDLWEVKKVLGTGSGNQRLIFKRPMLQTDWDCFDRYSVFVRKYKMNGEVNIVDATVFQALSIHLHSRPRGLLPNLRGLRWEADVILPHISLFLGPQLGKITLHLEDHPIHVWREVLPVLTALCPNIEVADIYDDDIDAPPPFDTLCRWQSLRNLYIGSISTTLFVHLATLPTFENLNVESLRYLQWGDIDSQIPDRDGFKNLHHLEIVGGDVDGCARMLEVSSLSLEDFNFFIPSIDDPFSLKYLLTALRDHCNHQSLKSVTVGEGGDFEKLVSFDNVITENHISSLFAFRDLVDVSITTTFDFVLTDDGVKRMAIAWPHVTFLKLAPQGITRHEPKTSLLSLLYLANYCPRLEELALVFDARAPRLDNPEQGMQPCRLHTLVARDSLITDPSMVATVFSRVFPKLSCVYGRYFKEGEFEEEHPGIVETNEKWAEVRELLKNR